MKKLIFIILLLIATNIANADEYYLGQWEWDDTCHIGNGGCWRYPNWKEATGGIDLRSIPQQSIAGGTPEGYAIFSYPSIQFDPNLIYIGNEKTITISDKTESDIREKLKYSGKITASTPKDLIYKILTEKADPTGETAWKPLMPDNNLEMKVYLGRDDLIKETTLIPFVSPEWEMVLATIQEDYKRLVKIEPEYKIAKMLDFLEEKYGVDYKIFIPDGYVQIASLPHQTTITDNFNRADSATLGTSSEGWSWTEVQNNFDISSNKVIYTTNNTAGYARANSALSSNDHYAQAVMQLTGSFSYPGVLIRKDSTSTITHYGSNLSPDVNTKIGKCLAGVCSGLGSTVAADSASTDHTQKLQISADQLKCYIDSIQVGGTVTDSSISANLYTGITQGYFLVGSTATWDNFEASDLAASVSTETIYDSTLYNSTIY